MGTRTGAHVTTLLMGIAVPFGAWGQSPSWRAERPCVTMADSSFLVRATEVRSHPCVPLLEGGLICEVGDGDSVQVVLRQPTGDDLTVLRTEVNVFSPRDTLEVIQADLDGDGSPEVIIPWFYAASNGMGVAYWTLHVLSRGRYGWAVGDSIDVQDYQTNGSWVTAPTGRVCDIIRTRWVNGFESGRREGLYLEAAWFTWTLGRFIQRVDRPVLRLRYLYSLESDRSQGAVENAPFGWLLKYAERGQ